MSPSQPRSSLARRDFLKYGGVTATVGLSRTGAAQPGSKPNIVVFLVDQMRADLLGCYGNGFTRTPVLDRFASRGVRFNRAYCGFPQCSPARASLMTGLYPNKTGIGIQSDYRMFGDRTVERLDKDLPSIFTLFKATGYQTGYVGKWHLSLEEPPPDFHDYGIDFFSPLPEFRSKQRPLVEEGRALRIAGFCDPPPLWRGEMTKQATGFIDGCSAQKKPFLLFYSDYRPHPPYFLPEQDFRRFAPEKIDLWPNLKDDLKGKPLTHRFLRERVLEGSTLTESSWTKVIQHYSATISAVDHDIGLVYDALEKNGVLDNTIVVFVSDHGDTCGAHGFLSKGVVAYEELIRIPMIISWPGHFQAGKSCDELVCLMDVLPTLLEATQTGVDPGQFDGRSLSAILRGQNQDRCRDYLLIMHHGNMYGLCSMRAVVGKRLKYVYYPYDTGEIYDLQTDPWEMRNLLQEREHQQTAAELHAKLKLLMREASDTRIAPR
ncbi:MAG: sulfatase-like hydrolase/transferase [Acidobacteriota bacterium]